MHFHGSIITFAVDIIFKKYRVEPRRVDSRRSVISVRVRPSSGVATPPGTVSLAHDFEVGGRVVPCTCWFDFSTWKNRSYSVNFDDASLNVDKHVHVTTRERERHRLVAVPTNNVNRSRIT